MNKLLILLLLICIMMGCNNNKPSSTVDTTSTKDTTAKSIIPVTDTTSGTSDTEPQWCDSITGKYIEYLRQTHNPLAYNTTTDTMYRISWSYEGTGSSIDDNYTGSFYIMHLRYVDDASPIYQSADWLYIDSITHKTYEYYAQDDTLRPIDIYKHYASGDFYPAGYIVNASNNHKVYFCNAPDSSTKRKAFFNTKQGVYVSKSQNGYGFIQFYNSKRQESDGWISMKDLLPYPND